jgi:16S rRNA pseudouridine516 synthase
MFNKPVGCVTARTDDRYPTVMDYFKELQNENLSPVGRLDLETEGLLIITDDGKWNQEMTNPAFQKEKRYEFTVLGMLTQEKKRNLEEGVKVIDVTLYSFPALDTNPTAPLDTIRVEKTINTNQKITSSFRMTFTQQ